MRNPITKRSAAAILSVFVCSTLAWILLGVPTSGVNDADVFLVYARNFIHGHGFVYNIGGEQVEGFPSVLWMFICSFFLIFSHAVELPLFLLNLSFGIIAIHACLKRCDQKPTFLVLLCAAPAWFAWCQISLVESGLWCLLLTFAILAVSEQRILRTTIMLPLLVLTRAESMLWVFWLILILLVEIGLERGWKVAVRSIFRPVFMCGIPCAMLLLFRGHAFGYLLPSNSSTNAFHGLKFNIGAGAFNLLAYLFSNPVVLLVVLVFGWVCIREISSKRGLSRPLAVGLCLLPGLAFPLIMEEKGLGKHRFYQPIWPLMCLVAAWAMPLLYNRLNTLLRRASPVALLLVGWLIFALSSNLKAEFRSAREGREKGAVLDRMFSQHAQPPSVAVIPAGGYKHSYPGQVYDLTGLTFTKMDDAAGMQWGARIQTPFSLDVFHEWYPDILVWSDSKVFDWSMFKMLESGPLFRKRYIKGELWYNDEVFFAYYSRRFIDGLPDGYYAFQQDLHYVVGEEDDSIVAWAGGDDVERSQNM